MLNDYRVPRTLYSGDYIKYKPRFKCFIVSNDLPDVVNCKAFWNRTVVIPFRANFVEEPTKPNERQRDEDLTHRWTSDPYIMSSLLNWLIEGAFRFYNDRSSRVFPACVDEAIKNYNMEQDLYGQFIIECLDEDPNGLIKARNLYEVYDGWASEGGMRPVSIRKFGGEIKKKI